MNRKDLTIKQLLGLKTLAISFNFTPKLRRLSV